MCGAWSQRGPWLPAVLIRRLRSSAVPKLGLVPYRSIGLLPRRAAAVSAAGEAEADTSSRACVTKTQ